MKIDNIISAWNDQADEYNNWDSLDADERVIFAMEFVKKQECKNRTPPAQEWVPVERGLPKRGSEVLACYLHEAGIRRRIRAAYVAAKTVVSSPDGEFSDYDEVSGTYYDPEGWYELIDNWGDYNSIAVCEGKVTHWLPMPEFITCSGG